MDDVVELRVGEAQDVTSPPHLCAIYAQQDRVQSRAWIVAGDRTQGAERSATAPQIGATVARLPERAGILSE